MSFYVNYYVPNKIPVIAFFQGQMMYQLEMMVHCIFFTFHYLYLANNIPKLSTLYVLSCAVTYKAIHQIFMVQYETKKQFKVITCAKVLQFL